MRAGWATFTLVLAVSGCTGASSGGAAGSSPAAPVTGSVAAPSPVPGQLDCGRFDLGQGESPPPSALTCFTSAFRNRKPAQLVVSRPTVEGDPIPQTFTSDPDGHVTVLTDSRKDKFGTPEVVREVCTGVQVSGGYLSGTGCTAPERVTP